VKVSGNTLRRIAAMPAEAMAAALLFLAEQLEADEAKRDANALRQQRYRERHNGVTVTQQSRENNGDVTPRVRVEDNYNLPTLVDTSRKNLSPPPPLPSRALEPDGFEEFWDAYPKRDGSADRKGAAKAFKAALRRATLETILDGTDHFRDAMTARGKVGTEYIPQARTWLNGDRWHERYDASSAADSKQAQNLAILEKYRAAPRS
jgi:hypothetical protein